MGVGHGREQRGEVEREEREEAARASTGVWVVGAASGRIALQCRGRRPAGAAKRRKASCVHTLGWGHQGREQGGLRESESKSE